MKRKAVLLMFIFSLLICNLILLSLSYGWFNIGRSFAIQQSNLPVRNRDTGKSYSTIQGAIDAPETLDGHEISVTSGIYYEHLTVRKSVSLVGEDRSTTIIDGNGTGRVVYVTAGNVEVRNFTIRRGTFGLWLDHSQNSNIMGNTIQDGSYGIRIYHSRNSEVIKNSVSGFTKFGVEIKSSGNATLRSNTMTSNRYNFGVDGNLKFDFTNDIDVSNTVNGKPIHYLLDRHNLTIDASTFPEMGYLGLVNSTNIEVKNFNVQNNVQGILFAFTVNSTISNVNAKENWYGIYVAHSSNVSVKASSANYNFDYGIKFFNSSRSTARGNNVDDNGWAGIGLFSSPNSTIEGNEANLNTYNLHLVYTNNSLIVRNNALAMLGDYSIAVYYSHNNLIYHNSFVDSLLYVESRNYTRFTPRNSWDNGLEGNYWSLHKGDDADQDGIGDTPYIVGENNTDNHPLMGRLSSFTITPGEVTYNIALISNSTISQFQLDPNERRISFNAVGESGTNGFSRIAVPNALFRELLGGNLGFKINGEPPVLRRNWTDGTCTYFYFSYANRASESAIGPWLLVTLASVLIFLGLLVFWILRGKLGVRRRLSEEKAPNMNASFVTDVIWQCHMRDFRFLYLLFRNLSCHTPMPMAIVTRIPATA